MPSVGSNPTPSAILFFIIWYYNHNCTDCGNTQVEELEPLLVLPDSDHYFVTTRKDE